MWHCLLLSQSTSLQFLLTKWWVCFSNTNTLLKILFKLWNIADFCIRFHSSIMYTNRTPSCSLPRHYLPNKKTNPLKSDFTWLAAHSAFRFQLSEALYPGFCAVFLFIAFKWFLFQFGRALSEALNLMRTQETERVRFSSWSLCHYSSRLWLYANFLHYSHIPCIP